ncbi:hypothetical protein Trydic_g19588 [Trypoxylus dichotomus]
MVFQLAEQFGLDINWKKCQFLQRQIEYLSHEVENWTIKPSNRKIKAVMKFLEAKTTKEIQRFLGLSGYLRKFIPGYSLIVRPLRDLLKNDAKFQFDEQQRIALKSALGRPLLLHVLQPGIETELHTDASEYGIAAIMLQRSPNDQNFHHYYSRKTSIAEQKYTTYELESKKPKECEVRPCRITAVNLHEGYELVKVSIGEGLDVTTAVKYMKPWKQPLNDFDTDSSEANEVQDGRVVGIEGADSTILDAPYTN